MSEIPATPSVPITAADDRDYNKHFRGYVIVGVLQMVFTIVTVALSYVNFASGTLRTLAILLSASVNATIVAAILMHLKGEKQFIWKVLFFTAIFMGVLFFLTFLSFSDPIQGTLHTHH